MEIAGIVPFEGNGSAIGAVEEETLVDAVIRVVKCLAMLGMEVDKHSAQYTLRSKTHATPLCTLALLPGCYEGHVEITVGPMIVEEKGDDNGTW